MALNALRLIGVILTAVAMAAGFAHLFELPNKIHLSREDYLTVQQIYRGWALLGIAVVGALLSTVALAVAMRPNGRTSLPANWQELRKQWEYSHAVAAGLYFIALVALTLSLLVER